MLDYITQTIIKSSVGIHGSSVAGQACIVAGQAWIVAGQACIVGRHAFSVGMQACNVGRRTDLARQMECHTNTECRSDLAVSD